MKNRIEPNGEEDTRVSAILALGSNLGDREQNLRRALALLEHDSRMKVIRVSSWRETDPIGGPAQGQYLNGVAEVETTLAPRELLERLHEIEASLGRVRSVRNAPRQIDLDILLYGDRSIAEPGLEIPHPRMLERGFVLEPLAEVAPARRHPRTGRTAQEHWQTYRSAGGGSGEVEAEG